MIAYNTLIVLLGTGLLGATSGLVGTFAVLRRRALTGDALAHAALPGLCVAFLVVGERSLPALLLGAFISGVLGVSVLAALARWTRIKEDAALGIVLSVFFGAGMVLSRIIQNQATGGSKAGLDSYILGKTAGMLAQDVYLVGGVGLGCLLLIALLYKELRLVAFDPAFARGGGWPVLLLDLLLMALMAVIVVVGLPAVGVVLMAALLILPPVTARLWTERLSPMLLLSAALGLAVGVIGTLLSAHFSKMPAGPIIVLVGTTFFLTSLLVAPRRGILARAIARGRFRRKLASQSFLRAALALAGDDNDPVALPLLQRQVRGPIRATAQRLARQGLLEVVDDEHYRLTEQGREQAVQATRQQRLWQFYLQEYPDVASASVDLDTETLALRVPAALLAELEAKLDAVSTSLAPAVHRLSAQGGVTVAQETHA
jgi:manganese/zinc/iron transport system permease protein